MPTNQWLTITEACARLRVTRNTVTRMCQDGRLIAVRTGTSGDWRIHPDLVVMPPTAADIQSAVESALANLFGRVAAGGRR